MFTLPIRVLFVIIALALGVHSAVTGRATWPLYFAGAAILVVSYFRSGTVWLAVRAIQTGKLDQARRLLDQIWNPTWLGSQSRAYYEWMRGGLASEGKQWQEARAHLETSLAHRLRTENDRSLVEGYLAAALFNCGDVADARERLVTAKGRNPKPEVQAILHQVEQEIANSS